ncbi:MAG: Fic family protein [Bacilli bacterium]
MIKNKLNIDSSSELANVEEKLTKKKALELFDKKILDTLEAGTFETLCFIHKYLFEDIYDFAGALRDVNIAKGNFRFTSVMYLEASIRNINLMPQDTLDQIIEKYIEMNVTHPFREGNGRSMRIWLDLILKKQLNKVIDWNKIDKEDYLLAMERSPIKDTEIKTLIKSALIDDNNDRGIYMKGIDHSYYYEGYNTYLTQNL